MILSIEQKIALNL